MVALALAGLSSGGQALAQPSATATIPAPAALNGSFTLAVDCASSPERTTLTNNTDGPFNLNNFALGSLFAPGPNEPFRLSGILPSGESRIFETGPGATANRLSDEEIYDDTAPREGVRLTGFGTPLETLCSARAITRAWRADPPAQPVSPPAVASPTLTAAPTATAVVPSLPSAGAGGFARTPPLLDPSLGPALLLVSLLASTYLMRRRGRH
jgi:hypothetical protein